MSDKTQTPPVAVVPETKTETEIEPKQNFVQRRVVTPIKKHPRIASAIVGGAALVGLAAFAGRKTAPQPEPELYFVTEEDLDELVQDESADTTVA